MAVPLFPFCHPSLLELDGVRVCWLPAAAAVSADGFFLAGRGSLTLFVARAASLTGSLVPCAPMYEPRSQVASARRTAAAARAAQAGQHKASTTRASSSSMSFHASHGVSLRNARGGHGQRPAEARRGRSPLSRNDHCSRGLVAVAAVRLVLQFVAVGWGILVGRPRVLCVQMAVMIRHTDCAVVEASCQADSLAATRANPNRKSTRRRSRTSTCPPPPSTAPRDDGQGSRPGRSELLELADPLRVPSSRTHTKPRWRARRDLR